MSGAARGSATKLRRSTRRGRRRVRRPTGGRTALDRLLIGDAMAQWSAEHRAVIRRSYYLGLVDVPDRPGPRHRRGHREVEVALYRARAAAHAAGDGGDAMTEFGGPATPPGGEVSSAVMISNQRRGTPPMCLVLCRSERLEYEAHLSGCPSCQEAVAELSGMPALLSRLDRDEVAAIDEGNDICGPTPPMRPELLDVAAGEGAVAAPSFAAGDLDARGRRRSRHRSGRRVHRAAVQPWDARDPAAGPVGRGDDAGDAKCVHGHGKCQPPAAGHHHRHVVYVRRMAGGCPTRGRPRRR